MRRRSFTVPFVPQLVAPSDLPPFASLQSGQFIWRPLDYSQRGCDACDACPDKGNRCPKHADVLDAWEPKIIRISARVLPDTNTPTTDYRPVRGAPADDVEVLISFVPRAAAEAASDGTAPLAGRFSALRNTLAVDPLAGWYRGVGDLSPRELTSAGEGGRGYLFPREQVPDSHCEPYVPGWQALVIQWTIRTGPVAPGGLAQRGMVKIDWEWAPRKV